MNSKKVITFIFEFAHIINSNIEYINELKKSNTFYFITHIFFKNFLIFVGIFLKI